MSGRRIELSATQVIASMLAAVTGAIAASYTGIAGTVIGVAVMSVASTAGAAVYKHYLARSQEKLHASKERLHAAAVTIAPRSIHATRNGAAGHRNRRGAPGLAREQGERAQATGELARWADEPVAAEAVSAALPGLAAGQVGWLLSPDSPGTDEFPAVSGEASGWRNSAAESANSAESAESAALAESAGPAGSAGAAGSAGSVESAKAAKTAGSHQVWRRWPALLTAAFGVFVLALAAITAFEVAAGKPLEALIWGRSGGGTTVGVITGAQHTGPADPGQAAPGQVRRQADRAAESVAVADSIPVAVSVSITNADSDTDGFVRLAEPERSRERRPVRASALSGARRRRLNRLAIRERHSGAGALRAASVVSAVRVWPSGAFRIRRACTSPRVGPSLTIATGMPSLAACRTNR